jgi:hypothetical protein
LSFCVDDGDGFDSLAVRVSSKSLHGKKISRFHSFHSFRFGHNNRKNEWSQGLL